MVKEMLPHGAHMKLGLFRFDRFNLSKEPKNALEGHVGVLQIILAHFKTNNQPLEFQGLERTIEAVGRSFKFSTENHLLPEILRPIYSNLSTHILENLGILQGFYPIVSSRSRMSDLAGYFFNEMKILVYWFSSYSEWSEPDLRRQETGLRRNQIIKTSMLPLNIMSQAH